jgi:hypothetical protein
MGQANESTLFHGPNLQFFSPKYHLYFHDYKVIDGVIIP